MAPCGQLSPGLRLHSALSPWDLPLSSAGLVQMAPPTCFGLLSHTPLPTAASGLQPVAPSTPATVLTLLNVLHETPARRPP